MTYPDNTKSADNMGMTTFSDNLKKFRKAARLSQTELAEACGWEYQSRVSAYELGRREPSLEDIQQLAKALDIPYVQLISGERQVSESAAGYSATNIEPGPDTKGYVPVISWVQAGAWHEAQDLNEPGFAEEFIPCPKPHGMNSFALRVQGDSMTAPIGRTYPEGAIIYVDPDLRGSAKPGDRIIAKLKNEDRVTFKQLAQDGDKMYLKALNPHHPPIFDEFRILGKVIGTWIED